MLKQHAWVDETTGEEVQPFEQLVPDYWYLVKDNNGLMIRFVEVVAGEESGTRIRWKFEEYERWGQQPDVQTFLRRLYAKYGASDPRPEYQVHCILESRSWKHSDEWKERMTMMQTFHVNPVMQGRVWTTTKEAIDKALSEGHSINHDIWHRAKDFLGTRRQQWDRATDGTRTKLVDQFMKRLETYPLFA